MRGIPRVRVVVVGEAGAVGMAEHRLAEFAARPIVAGHVDVAREGAPLAIGAGQSIVPNGGVADASDDGAALGKRAVAAELVVGAVEITDVLGDDDALRVLPRTVTDAIAGVDGLGGRGFRRAEIRVPRLAARACRGRQLLTMGIRARKPAEIATLSEGRTGDEETHVGRLRHLLRLRVAAQAEQQHSRGCRKQKTQGVVHRSSSVRLVLGLLAKRPLAGSALHNMASSSFGPFLKRLPTLK